MCDEPTVPKDGNNTTDDEDDDEAEKEKAEEEDGTDCEVISLLSNRRSTSFINVDVSTLRALTALDGEAVSHCGAPTRQRGSVLPPTPPIFFFFTLFTSISCVTHSPPPSLCATDLEAPFPPSALLLWRCLASLSLMLIILLLLLLALMCFLLAL
jgi:hypothetical protein